MALIWSATSLEWYLDVPTFPVSEWFQEGEVQWVTRVALEPNHTEQNPHLVDTAVSPDRIQLVLLIKIPDRLDFLADFGNAEVLDRLPGVLVPKKKPVLYHPE